ncbi:hypothetical protein PPL_05901 [Heterostelium album PN500]|uniref:Dynein axonemal assembly factor 5 TPR repeats domain-containing protein n=1 Tax=Heterostelium pallidum (strain ATCC 26659 / Pp 5 / PN500) TaxID=670386 RepID=D3BBN2_HETP5|nr:hypothetical protein PPL_05901 [Heterostelium album PN500]EFA81065.1 hypothetical protein PPL_05901 [Heterostelium album PN500]|eukprot:XP_020433183.1 hypothetical protein PPL_05901 [Heterostelium album PN500]
MIFNELKDIINSDVNILCKEGGSTFQRKKAIERLQKSIVDNADLYTNDRSHQIELIECLSSCLLTLLQDGLERSRMFSISMMTHLAVSTEPGLFVTTMFDRRLLLQLDNQLAKEEVEEVRINIIELIDTLITKNNNNNNNNNNSIDQQLLSAYCEQFVVIFKRALTDRNHQQIELTTATIIHLTEKIPTRMLLYTGQLVPSLINNLADRHQKIRSLSLQALTVFVSKCGAIKMIDAIEQHLTALAIDHSPAVRNTLATSLQHWMCSDVRSSFRQHNALLLNCLLSLCASDIPNVLESSHQSLSNIAQICLKEEVESDEQQDKETTATIDIDSIIKSLNLTWYQSNTMAIDERSKKYLRQNAKKIMRYYYSNFHNNELDPNSREIKVGILVYATVHRCHSTGSFSGGKRYDTVYSAKDSRDMQAVPTTTAINDIVLLNLLQTQLQLLYTEQSNRCQSTSLEILTIVSMRFNKAIHSGTPKSINLITRLLILLDISLSLSTSVEQLNQISQNISTINYQQFIDNNTNMIFEDIIGKDINHIKRYPSYLTTLEYIVIN